MSHDNLKTVKNQLLIAGVLSMFGGTGGPRKEIFKSQHLTSNKIKLTDEELLKLEAFGESRVEIKMKKKYVKELREKYAV